MYLFIGKSNPGVQGPSQYCSPNRLPDLTPQQLQLLSRVGLDAAPVTVEHNTPVQPRMKRQQDPDASSSTKFDLNLTVEENERNIRRK